LNEDDSIASELAAARSRAYIAFTQQPLLDFAVDDILTFDWQKLFTLCFANNIPINCGVEEQDLVNDLVLSLLAHQRELVASRILSSMASIQDGHEVSGGDSHKDHVSGDSSSLPCSSGPTCPGPSSLVHSVATKEAVHEDFLDSSSPQEHGKLAMGEGGALDFDLGGDCPFSTFFGVGVTPVSNFSINDLTTPPPSYWIGLSRPPPAPNWQRFAIERARIRPPPAPKLAWLHPSSTSPQLAKLSRI
jgi:hypothetical protein